MKITTKNLCPCLDCKIGTVTYRKRIITCKKNCLIYQKWLSQQKIYASKIHWMWDMDTDKDLGQKLIIRN